MTASRVTPRPPPRQTATPRRAGLAVDFNIQDYESVPWRRDTCGECVHLMAAWRDNGPMGSILAAIARHMMTRHDTQIGGHK